MQVFSGRCCLTWGNSKKYDRSKFPNFEKLPKLNIKDQCFLHSYIYNGSKNICNFIKSLPYSLSKKTL